MQVQRCTFCTDANAAHAISSEAHFMMQAPCCLSTWRTRLEVAVHNAFIVQPLEPRGHMHQHLQDGWKVWLQTLCPLVQTLSLHH